MPRKSSKQLDLYLSRRSTSPSKSPVPTTTVIAILPSTPSATRAEVKMTNPFFEHPILNSPYERPAKHWELDDQGQPTQQIIENRRRAEFITPIPKPKKRKKTDQQRIVFDEGKGLSTEKQEYDPHLNH